MKLKIKKLIVKVTWNPQKAVVSGEINDDASDTCY
jgi:hypothetical protein